MIAAAATDSNNGWTAAIISAIRSGRQSTRPRRAGRGFAVVAGEVKALSIQTRKATEEIALKIDQLRRSGGLAPARGHRSFLEARCLDLATPAHTSR
jgi:hypothetical protein